MIRPRRLFLTVVAHLDLNWAQDLKFYKSVTSYFILLAYGVTFWLSHQQKTVALSSTETEYIVFSDCSYQLSWMMNFLKEIGFNVFLMFQLLIYSDNLSLLFWSSNPIQKKCSKHI